MPSFDEARGLILGRVAPLGAERVALGEAAWRVASEAFRAPGDLPAWDNSAMDGYAVRAADCAGDARLVVRGYHPAGVAGETAALKPGFAVRIMTGGKVPAGSDAIVPLEDAEPEAGAGARPGADAGGGAIRVPDAVLPGAHVRRRGEDVAKGDLVFAAGTMLRPPEIGMLASFGRTDIAVFRKARVGVLATGDELVEPGEPVPDGKIVNSSSLSLAAAIRHAGAEPVLLGIARDDRKSLEEKLSEGFGLDALVTTAGVSMGDRDLVREALAALGAEPVFWKVDVRPGRPTAFGMKGTVPVFSLPGNPVSTLLTFEAFVRPALLRMMGHADPLPAPAHAVLGEAVGKKAGRTQMFRVRLSWESGVLTARSAGEQATAVLSTSLRADAIALLPPGRTSFEAGERVAIRPLYAL